MTETLFSVLAISTPQFVSAKLVTDTMRLHRALALAAATGTAKTPTAAEGEASQSGGEAVTPTTKAHQNPISGGDN